MSTPQQEPSAFPLPADSPPEFVPASMADGPTPNANANAGSPQPEGKRRRPSGGARQPRATSTPLGESVSAVLDARAGAGARRRAYQQIVAAARRDWTSVADALRQHVLREGEDPAALTWLGCECALDGQVLERTAGASLDHLDVTTAAAASALRLAKSVWITGKTVSADWESASGRRRRDRLPSPAPNQAIDEHAMLAVDGTGKWPARISQATSGETEPLPVSDAVLDRLAEADAPLARELRSRRELLILRERGGSMDGTAVRRLAAGRRVLEATVRGGESSWGASQAARDAYGIRLVIAQFVGRKPEVWGTLDKARRSLIEVPPSTPADLARWAELVSLTHATTPESMRAVADVPDAALPPLLHAAARHDLRGLIQAAQGAVMQRVNHGRASAELCRGVLALLDEAPSLRGWIGKYVAPYIPSETQAGNAAAAGTVLLAHARTAALDELLGQPFVDRLNDAEPGLRVVALACVAARIKRELPGRQRAHADAAIRRLRAHAAELALRAAQVEEILGALPPRLEQLVSGARDEAVTAARAIEDARIDAPAPSAAEPIVPLPHGLEGDVLQALRALEFDPSRRPESEKQQRTALQGSLAWLATYDPGALSAVDDAAPTLPPEAAGALWETGVQRRAAPLLTTVGTLMAVQPWAERVWTDVLLRAADHGDGALPIADDVALRTCDLLQARIADLEAQRLTPDPTGDIARAVERARVAAEVALRSAGDLISGALATIGKPLEI